MERSNGAVDYFRANRNDDSDDMCLWYAQKEESVVRTMGRLGLGLILFRCTTGEALARRSVGGRKRGFAGVGGPDGGQAGWLSGMVFWDGAWVASREGIEEYSG